MRVALPLTALGLAAAALLTPAGEEAGPGEQDRVVVQAVGDLMLSAVAERTMRERGFDWAFEGTRSLLAEGDLNLANLETPVTTRGVAARKQFTFRQHPDSLPALRRAGIHLVALANNHSGDYGQVGFLDTLEHLKAAGIAHAGVGRNLAEARRPAMVEVKGRRVGVLSYSLTHPEEFYATRRRAGTPFGHEAWVRQDVRRWRSELEVLLVCFHWGAERMTQPKEYQRRIGRAAIESGADAVFGTHPHVLQGIELVEGRPIFYSLGNYAFGSRSSPLTGRSVIARVVFAGGNRIVAVLARPINVRNEEVDYNPRPADGALGASIASDLAALSAPLGTRVLYEDGWARVVPPRADDP